MTGLNLEPVAGAHPDAPALSGKSPLDRIRAIYQKAQGGHKPLDLPIPRNPVMGVRYRAIDPDEYDTTATKSRDQQLDLLIAACDCIVIRDGKRWEPLTHGGEPVGFDEVLSEIAGLGVPSVEDGGTAREYVLAAFKTAPVPSMAVALHVDRLTDWMAGIDAVDEEAVLGES